MARITWSVPLPGPFRVGGTLWKSKPKKRSGYHGKLPGWTCPHNHSRPDLANECAQREAKRRQVAEAEAGRARAQAQAQRFADIRQAMREMARQLRAMDDSCANRVGFFSDAAFVMADLTGTAVPVTAAETAKRTRKLAAVTRMRVEGKTGKNLAKSLEQLAAQIERG